MRRSRLSRSGLRGVAPKHHSVHFKTKLRHALAHISATTGHPIHVLEQKFMANFHKMPLDKQNAVTTGVLTGGMFSSMLVAGVALGAPSLGLSLGLPALSYVVVSDVRAKREMAKQRKLIEETKKEV